MGVTWATGSVGEMGETGVFGACSDDGLNGPSHRWVGTAQLYKGFRVEGRSYKQVLLGQN